MWAENLAADGKAGGAVCEIISRSLAGNFNLLAGKVKRGEIPQDFSLNHLHAAKYLWKNR
jgi:hypothetical protein